MRKFLVVLVLLLWTCAAPAQGLVVPTGLSIAGQYAWNAQGTYAASTLPKMCVNGHVNTATSAQTKTLLTTLGTKCARIDWNWDILEVVSNTYRWTTNTLTDPSGPVNYATWFGDLCSSGYQLLFDATYNNPLYSPGALSFVAVAAGANTTAYANFVAAQASESVLLSCPNSAEEIYNEPNLPQWTNNIQWSGQSYEPVIAAVSTASKGAQSSVKVISGGLTPGNGTFPNPWVAGMVGTGNLPNVDYYGLHPYSYNTSTPSLTPNPDVLLTDLQSFWLTAASTGHPKPISVTEWGYPWDALSTTVTQAGLNLQGVYTGWGMLNSVIANVTLGSPGISHFVTYSLVDDGTNYLATDQNSFGAFFNGSASSGSPITGATAYGIKPSGTAFKSVTGAMAGATTYTIAYDIPNSATRITFNNSLGANIALWTQDASSTKSVTYNIGAGFSSVTCKDLINNAVTCTYNSGTGALGPVALSVGVGPVVATALN